MDRIKLNVYGYDTGGDSEEYLLELDEICKTCHGDGIMTEESLDKFGEPEYKNKQCFNCDGIGFITTYEGDQLIKFIHRHMDISISTFLG